MARLRLFDMLQSHTFWVFDASGAWGNVLFSVFDPVLGFSSCSMPEINLELREVQPGNWEHKRRVVKKADVGPITLARGARFWDSDFFVWIRNAMRGIQPVRRNLVIVQFLGFRPLSQVLAAQGYADGGKSVVGPERGTTALVDRFPGRAWWCASCLPTRYKAGSDLDATNSQVSIMELEVQPEHVEELTIATTSPVVARAFSLSLAVAEAATAAPGEAAGPF